jgi:hypothetical protein
VSRYQLTRRSKAQPGDFVPLFDWDGDADRDGGGSDPVDTLRAACAEHVEAGGLIARQFFGVKVVNRKRLNNESPLTGTYKAANYCDPLAALLDGQPYGCGILPDAGRLLGVDEYRLAGFIHGLDRTEFWVGRREEKFGESPSYRAGHVAGREIGAEFARIQVGWEAQ